MAALAITAFASGCYQPRPLDARMLLGELRSEAPTQSAIPRAAGSGATVETHSLTADEAVVIALRNNPDLRAMRYQVAVAEGQLETARTLPNPTIGLELMHIQEWRVIHGASWQVQASWAVPQPVVFMAGIAAARDQLRAVRGDIADFEWQLELSVRAQHAGLVAIAEQRRLVDQALDTRRRIEGFVEKQLAGGAATRLNTGLAGLSVAEVERARDTLIEQEISSLEQLALLLGVPRVPGVGGVIPDEAELPADLEKLEQAAVAARPALAAESERYAAREQVVRSERAQRWPWFQLQAAPRYRSNDIGTTPNDWGFGIQLVLPLINFNTGPIEAAEAARDQEREQFRKLVVTIRTQLASSIDEINVYRKTVRRYREHILPQLDQQEMLLNASVAGGEINVVAVLTAQDVILRSRREYTNQRLALYQAWLSLDRAIGRPAITQDHAGQ